MKQVRTIHRGNRVPFAQVIRRLTGLNADEVATLIAMGGAYLGKPRCKDPDRLVRDGDEVAAWYRLPIEMTPVAFDPAWLVHRDDDILIANKPAGMPTQGRRDADYLAFYVLLAEHLPGYLGLHHRLDQGTSGLMLFTRHRARNTAVASLFRDRLIEKRYLGIAAGDWRGADEQTIDASIAAERGPNGTRQRVRTSGQQAITDLRRLASDGDLHLFEARPRTGRTHQIRVHMAHLGLPLLGDTFYGGRPHARFFLHSHILAWPDHLGLKAGSYAAPVPGDWPETLRPPHEEKRC